MFCLGLAEMPPLPWGRDSPDVNTAEVVTGRLGERERGFSLDTCMIQGRLLVRLRRLVMRSIDQVKRCLNPTILDRWVEIWGQIFDPP